MFKRFRWVFLVKLPAGALAGLLIAAVVTCLTPKIYESEAVIEVKPCANLPVVALGRTEGEVPGWLLSEIEKMKATDIDLATLKAEGVVGIQVQTAKLIKSGDLKRKVNLKGIKASKGAQAAVTAAGGTLA